MSIVSVDCVRMTGYAVTRPRPLSGSNSESSTVNADPSADEPDRQGFRGRGRVA